MSMDVVQCERTRENGSDAVQIQAESYAAGHMAKMIGQDNGLDHVKQASVGADGLSSKIHGKLGLPIIEH